MTKRTHPLCGGCVLKNAYLNDSATSCKKINAQLCKRTLCWVSGTSRRGEGISVCIPRPQKRANNCPCIYTYIFGVHNPLSCFQTLMMDTKRIRRSLPRDPVHVKAAPVNNKGSKNFNNRPYRSVPLQKHPTATRSGAFHLQKHPAVIRHRAVIL